MLPPFVPPSARASSESLPLITEFVVDRGGHPFERPYPASFDAAGTDGGVATLPSIDEFLMVAAAPANWTVPAPDEFVHKTSRAPSGAYEASEQAGTEAHIAPVAITAAALEVDMLLPTHPAPVGSEDAILNQTVERAEDWEASASSNEPSPPAETPASKDEPSGGASESGQPMPPHAPEEWIARERDAFDWHSVASLAVPPAEEARAAEEWSSTEWDRSSASVEDHISGLLAQVARRVRSGELEVQGSRQMGVEAALVSVLAALLAESAKK
ncbi:MAG: hypothetical protein M3R65_10135 [Gemmatimonadota bacterium]|nr:hypothetical protein [Gemmatimonadota bacterium]